MGAQRVPIPSHLVLLGPRVRWGGRGVAAPGRALGQSPHSRARCSPWLGAGQAPRGRGKSPLAGGSGTWGCDGRRAAAGRSPPCTGQLLARDQAADSRSLPELLGAPILLQRRAVVGRMGLPPPLHPGPAAGWAALPCSPVSLHPSITTLVSGESLFPAVLGIAAVVGACSKHQPKLLPTHPGPFDGLEPQRVCREIASSPARCWLSAACLLKTSCIKLQGFNSLSLASSAGAGVVLSYPGPVLAWPKYKGLGRLCPSSRGLCPRAGPAHLARA